MKNRLTAVRDTVVDVIQIGLRLIFSVALIWVLAMLLGVMSPLGGWKMIFWVASLIFVILAVRSNLSEIGRHFKEKLGWLTVTSTDRNGLRDEIHPLGRWALDASASSLWLGHRDIPIHQELWTIA